MEWIHSLKLIRFFDFYLALMFITSVVLRWRQYSSIVDLVRDVPSRWPRLFEIVKHYRHLFLTWSTISPLMLSLSLLLFNTLLRHLFLRESDALTVETLSHSWWGIPVLITGLMMLAFDLYCTLNVADVDQKEMEKYFDQAEYWLRSKMAPVVKVFTFGYINPRRMVDTEVRKALVDAGHLMSTTLWWVVAQVSFRLLYGTALWLAFAQTRP